MSAESGTDKTVRREKIVMALGIVAIILFSANLFTMIARHVWPDFRYMSRSGGDCRFAETQFKTVETATNANTVHVFVNRQGNVEADLRAEMNRLSRDIAHQQRRLDVDMNTRPNARLRTLRLDRVEASDVREMNSVGSEN